MQKNEIVVKIIEGAGFRTASFARIRRVRKGIAFTGNGIKADAVDAYDAKTGEAKKNYILGFWSYLVSLDGGVLDQVKAETVR